MALVILTSAALWPAEAGAEPAPAAPGATASPTSAGKTMEAELRRGRALADRGAYADAVKAFDAALAAVPDDPRVLVELGSALREAGDLTRAEAVCTAVIHATDNVLRAQALYNLGRVKEQRGHLEEAIYMYKWSLEVRPDRRVEQQLRALDPTSGAKLQIYRLEGPVASLADWCTAQLYRPCPMDRDYPDVKLDRLEATVNPSSPHTWQDLELFVIGDEQSWGDCALALLMASGWFVERIPDCHQPDRFSEVSVRLEDVIDASKGDEIQIRFHGVEHEKERDQWRDSEGVVHHTSWIVDSEVDDLVVCGIGPSGIPHCTQRIPLAWPLEFPEIERRAKLAARWVKGTLVLERADGWPDGGDRPPLSPSLRARVGTHHIRFP